MTWPVAFIAIILASAILTIYATCRLRRKKRRPMFKKEAMREEK